mmetsp:Transcript_35248/g.82202  ORF Transcript_35248/g.82202 Transcript_35248/m.82202 type:complete len:261 (-) Transcript_35248:3327-4109(-)
MPSGSQCLWWQGCVLSAGVKERVASGTSGLCCLTCCPPHLLNLEPLLGSFAVLKLRELFELLAACQVLHVSDFALALEAMIVVSTPARCRSEPHSQTALLELVILLRHALPQPLRDLDPGAWVGDLLVSCRNRDELLENGAKALLVILPVDNRAHVKVGQAVVLQPVPKPCLLHFLFSKENLDWNCPLRAAGIHGLVCNEHVSTDALCLEHGGHAEELGQPTDGGCLHGLVGPGLLHRLAHSLVLREEMDHLVVCHRAAS